MDRAEDLQMHNWRSAQAPILLGGSLIPAALQLLRFLRDVDQHPCLYRGPAVSHAIRRYEDFWLPLLNQHNATFPLHPPLDCAWIWHVHRLNPIAYARDCEMLFGRLLDVSCEAHDDKSSSVELTRRLWEQRFPDESYDLDLSRFQYDTQWVPHMRPENATRIEYNLADAVMRQQGFFYQVSQSHFEDERFLEGAQQRYKAFLHLFKITEFKMFLVPTYDIDLMWHAHQLHPKTYVEDLTKFLGRVLEHDDSDSDRSPGQKLDKGFHETCELWLQNYGDVYEREGAMYRGLPPAPVPPSHQIPAVGTPIDFAPLTPREVMQVYVTILRVQNLPKKQGDIRVRLQLERKCSSFKLKTLSVPLREGAFWKHTWTFQAEKSTKALKIELLRRHSSILTQMMKGSDVLGYTSVSWEYLLSMPTLSLSGWLPLTLGVPQSNCPSLYVSISLTPLGPTPYLLRMINSLPTDDKGRMGMGGLFDRRGCCLTRTVLDHSNKQVFIIRAKFSDGFTHTPEDKKCIYIHQGGWVYKNSHSTRGYAPAVVAVANQVVTGQESKNELSKQRCWCFFGNTSELLVRASDVDLNWDLRLDLELRGNLRGQVRLVCGRKLDYEVKGATEEEERGFVTVIRYNLADAPFGKATALFNWRTGAMEVSQQESVVLILLLSSIISRSVLDMKHVRVKFNPRRRPPPRSEETPDEWGSVVVQSGEGGKMAKSMAPFYVWWNMSALNWSTMFYTSSNTMFGASGCGAAGSCGVGACGGSACGGAGCGGAAGGGCGGGGGGCGGGGCGGGGG